MAMASRCVFANGNGGRFFSSDLATIGRSAAVCKLFKRAAYADSVWAWQYYRLCITKAVRPLAKLEKTRDFVKSWTHSSRGWLYGCCTLKNGIFAPSAELRQLFADAVDVDATKDSILVATIDAVYHVHPQHLGQQVRLDSGGVFQVAVNGAVAGALLCRNRFVPYVSTPSGAQFTPTPTKLAAAVRRICVSAAGETFYLCDDSVVYDSSGMHVQSNVKFISAVCARVATVTWDGKAFSDFKPLSPTPPCAVDQLLLGKTHSLLLSETGTVYACGDNSYGQLGLGHQRAQAELRWELVKGLLARDIVQVCVGENCSAAISRAGQLFGWGRNSDCQLGFNTIRDFVTVPAHADHLNENGLEVEKFVMAPKFSLVLLKKTRSETKQA